MPAISDNKLPEIDLYDELGIDPTLSEDKIWRELLQKSKLAENITSRAEREHRQRLIKEAITWLTGQDRRFVFD